MKKYLFLSLSLFGICTSISAQKTIRLWPGKIPFSTGVVEKEIVTDRGHVRNVQDPELIVYLPEKEKATGAAVVICPGGGYAVLAIGHEGHDIAKWFNEFGVAGIVLKYRLPTSDNIVNNKEVPLSDVQRAIRTVRFNAEKWGISHDKIGVMGFSAGGHLASAAGTHFNDRLNVPEDDMQKVSCRPDFMILVYPVISMSEGYMHRGSMKNLLGPNAAREDMIRFSNDLQVTADTPPAFLVHSSDDKAVPVQNSISFYTALQKNGVLSELHIFKSGGHGYGLGRKDGASHNLWPENCKAWMKEMKFIE